MNILRFNEVFEAPVSQHFQNNKAVHMLTSPLFSVEYTTDAIQDLGNRLREQKCIETTLPFKELRLNVRIIGVEDNRYVVSQTDDGMIDVLVNVKNPVIHIGNVTHMLVDPVCEIGKTEIIPLAVFYPSSKRWVTFEEHKQTAERMAKARNLDETVESDLSLFVTRLYCFALDVMNPSNHIVEVRPDTCGKSVEWTKQRTHYTVITHGHPANKRHIANGAVLPSNGNSELTRMAHARRAHYRQLRAKRFTYAKGKSVLVRSCWVGPKEWRESGSKQIYRILEPVEP